MFRGLKSLLFGLAAGTALGVLFAPKKGQELRKSIKKEMNEGGTGLGTIKDAATVMGKDMKDTAEDAYGNLEKNPKFKKAKSQVMKSDAMKEAKKAVNTVADKFGFKDKK